MPKISSLTEFRVELDRVMTEHTIKGKMDPVEYMKLEVEIAELALDYADGFYHSRVAGT